MTNPLQLIICTFDGTDKADDVKKAIEALDRQLDTIKLGNIAVVKKNDDGQIVFHEKQDRRERIGKTAGAVVEGVTWLLYNFVGMLGPVAGPYAGQETKALVEGLGSDVGFPDDALREIGARLDAGHSAIVTLVKPEEESIVVAELERLGGHLVGHELPADVVAKLSSESQS